MLLVAILGAGLVACGSDSDSGENSTAEETSQSEPAVDGIEGTTWEVMNLGSNEGWATSVPQQVPPPTLRIEDGQAAIFAGCNSGSASVEVGETTITFGPVAITKKSCEQVQNQVEFLVTKVLQGEVTYEINADGNLVIDRNGNVLVYTPA